MKRSLATVVAAVAVLAAPQFLFVGTASAADPAPVYGYSQDNDEDHPGYILDGHYAKLSAALSPTGACPVGGWSANWTVAHRADEAGHASATGVFANVTLAPTDPGSSPVPRSQSLASQTYGSAQSASATYPTSQATATLAVTFTWTPDAGTIYQAVTLTLTADRPCTPEVATTTTTTTTTILATTTTPTVLATTTVPTTIATTSVATVSGSGVLPKTGGPRSLQIIVGLAAALLGVGIITTMIGRREDA